MGSYGAELGIVGNRLHAQHHFQERWLVLVLVRDCWHAQWVVPFATRCPVSIILPPSKLLAHTWEELLQGLAFLLDRIRTTLRCQGG